MDGFQHFCTDFRLCIGGLYADEELPYSQSGDVKVPVVLNFRHTVFHDLMFPFHIKASFKQ